MGIFDELLNVFNKAAGEFEPDRKRAVTLDTVRGEYLYSDKDSQYHPLVPAMKRGLSTVESLATAVLEEARRVESPQGDFMTVIFTEKGGMFYPNDKARVDEWSFDRTHSQQWQHLMAWINRPLKHKDFIRVLQGLRPSIKNHLDTPDDASGLTAYAALMRIYRSVSFDSNTKVTSQPMITAGKTGGSVNFTMTTKAGGEQEVDLPTEIPLVMPFVKGSETLYQFTVEVDAALDEDTSQPVFMLVFPDRENIVDQAISDEVAYFKRETEKLPNLLVLLDY